MQVPRVVVVLALSLLTQACASPPVMNDRITSAAAPVNPAAEQQARINQQILAALKQRRYADAIRATRSANASQVEIDFAVGELALQGWADTRSTQRPLESIAEALALIEAAAMKEHRQAISSLAATFAVGLRDDANQTVLVSANPKLNACWEAAKLNPRQSGSCVAMRLGRPSD